MRLTRFGIVLLALAASAVAASDLGPLFEPVRSLGSPADTGSGEPFLAVAPDGRVWLSWFERRRRGGHAFRAARLEGSRWSRALTIAEGDSFFVNWADFPTLLPLARGRLAAHWPWRSGADVYAYDVRFSQTRDGGATWSAPLAPHRDGTPTEHGFVSMLAEGDAVRAVWLDGRDYARHAADTSHASGGEHGMKGEMSLRTARIGLDGSVSEESVIDPRVCDCCQTAAVRATRGVLVAYRDRSNDEVRDISLARYERGRWTMPYPLHGDGWKIAACPVNGPALDAVGDRVAAAWYTGARDSEQVLVSFSGDGGVTFGAPIRVDEGAPLGRVDVVALDGGAALVLWLETAPGDGKEARVLLRRVDRDGRRSGAATIATTSSARSSGFPRMVRSGDGIVFAWTSPGKPARVETAVARLK